MDFNKKHFLLIQASDHNQLMGLKELTIIPVFILFIYTQAKQSYIITRQIWGIW